MKNGDLVVNKRGEIGVIVDDKIYSRPGDPSFSFMLVSYFGEWEGKAYASHLNDLTLIKGEDENESR
jgi:hypothetical protein